MPISLLLQELTKRRLEFLPAFDAWSRWLALDELILARARGAFLVHWFGLGIPTEGLAVAGYIRNIAELRSQYLWARSQTPGLNVFEPLAGWAGGLVGSLLGVFLGLISVFVPMSIAVLGVIAAVVFGLGSLLAPLANDPVARAVYRVSGGITEVISELLQIWTWLTGPRDQIRNPLIREALNILDKIPLITSHLVAFIAILLARVLPYVGRLATQIPLLFDVVRESVSVIQWAIGDVKEQLLALADGPRSPLGLLKYSLRLLKKVPKLFKSGFGEIFSELTTGLSALVDAVSAEARPWLDEIRDALANAVSPFTTFVDALILTFTKLGDLFPSRSSSSSSSSSSLPSPVPDDATVRRLIQPFVGDRPALSPDMIPDLAAELRRLRAEGVAPDLDAFFQGTLVVSSSGEVPTEFSRMSALGRLIAGINLSAPSVFAGEQLALQRFAGGPPAQALAELHAQDLQSRNLIGSIIDRMLPASAMSYWEQLVPLLERIDRDLFELPSERRRIVYPVLDLREEDRLRLEVGRVRLRYRGPAREELRDQLRELGSEIRLAWIGQSYTAPAVL